MEKLKLDTGELTEDLRLLLSDGRQVQGADVYRYAMKRIWWAYPLYLFSVLPLTRHAFDRGYTTFAKHRHQVSRLCGLPGSG
jgi:predicted DCC family thiol-disulfide oxidoreductase YuxK